MLEEKETKEELDPIERLKIQIKIHEEELKLSFFDPNTFELGKNSLAKMSTKQKEKYKKILIQIRKMIRIGNHQNTIQQLKTALCASIYITTEEEKIKNYGEKEFVLLSKLSGSESPSFFETANLFYPNEIISIVLAKSRDYLEAENILLLVEKWTNEKKEPKEIFASMKEKDRKVLNEEANQYQKEIVIEVEKELNESRRI